ncbi:MAG: class I SAM-dependent methyltransferase [Thermoguttaceae bacterium]
MQTCAAASIEQTAVEEILRIAGTEGGLVVHLGCGDGRLTAALADDERFLVHGLDADERQVEDARAYVRSVGRYGRVSIDSFDGKKRLPYVDNVVNLLVAEDLGRIPMAEVFRVLTPDGVALIGSSGSWTKTVKPRPAEIDEWTHYMHDASNNAVAHDERVGPPRHLQWQCGPRWSRHHDHMASVSAMVSAGGRVFSIVGEVVYATLGIDAPVTAVDAASGKVVRRFAETAGAEEIVYKDGVLLVVVNRTPFDLDVDLADDPQEGKTSDGRTTYSPAMQRIWAGVGCPGPADTIYCVGV